MSNELYRDAEIYRHMSMKHNFVRRSSREAMLRYYQSHEFRTTCRIPGVGKSLVDFTVYYLKRGSVENYYLAVTVTSLRSRSESYSLFMDKDAMLDHLDSELPTFICEQHKLMKTLEKCASLLILNRRSLYRELELSHKIKTIQSECFSNDYKYSKNPNTFLEKIHFETELLGHFIKRFDKEYAIISVYRHLIQDMFTIKISMRSTFKKYIIKLHMHDLMTMMQESADKILPVNYTSLEYLAGQAKNIKQMLKHLNMFDQDELKNMEIKRNAIVVGIMTLSVHIDNQRYLLAYLWERIIQRMRLSRFRSAEPMACIESFSYILKEILVHKYFVVNSKQRYWIEVKLGKTTIDDIYLPYDHTRQPTFLLDTDLMVSVSRISDGSCCSERIAVRDMLDDCGNMMHKINNCRFKIIDLLTLGRRIYEVITDRLLEDGTVRFKDVIQKKSPEYSLTIKISEDPVERIRPPKGLLLKRVDQVYLLESKKMTGVYPITICTFPLTRQPMQLCTCLLLSVTTIAAIVQDIESQRLSFKEFVIADLNATIPFISHLISSHAYDIVGHRLQHAIHNTMLLVDIVKW